jgi:hypothetical protein
MHKYSVNCEMMSLIIGSSSPLQAIAKDKSDDWFARKSGNKIN